MGAADAAVAAMPALTLVCFDDVRRFVVFLIQFQNVAGAILHAAATLDAFLESKTGGMSFLLVKDAGSLRPAELERAVLAGEHQPLGEFGVLFGIIGELVHAPPAFLALETGFQMGPAQFEQVERLVQAHQLVVVGGYNAILCELSTRASFSRARRIPAMFRRYLA